MRSGRSRRIRARFNAVLTAATLVIAVLLVVLSELLHLGRGGEAVRRLVRLVAPIVGVTFEIRGRERLDASCAYVLTPNHSSLIDIPALLVAHPRLRFTAAAELFDHPVLGPAVRALGTIPVERQHPEVARERFAEVAARLGPATCVVIFPEGQLAPSDRLLPFKSGAFVFAIQAGVAVVPVAIHGASSVLPRGARFAVAPGRIVVEILDPIPTQGYGIADRHVLCDQARTALDDALRQ